LSVSLSSLSKANININFYLPLYMSQLEIVKVANANALYPLSKIHSSTLCRASATELKRPSAMSS
jgi:hypothetical protein